ncbi:hypothetical protein [Desulfotruncus arcticus]|uniref:hypothetical protein n=1 Tax=Desulfotruncus arcticus TaxID=341036 RepID=UPI0013F4EF3A|nr:hypothetical protein [Desulfotruncus arcticus]
MPLTRHQRQDTVCKVIRWIPGVSGALDAVSSPSNPQRLAPKGRKVTLGCLLQALCYR